MTDTNYREKAEEEAKDMLRYHRDEVAEALSSAHTDTGVHRLVEQATDRYLWESVTDRAYSLREAADVIEELFSVREMDSGLWDGQEPFDAISTMAAYTFRNAVASEARDLVDRLVEAADQLREDHEAEHEDDEHDVGPSEEDYRKLVDRVLSGGDEE
jgi:hypothetical protein